jgi:5'-3' exoribonuclease 1
LPIKSLRITLPKEYVALAKNELKGFFPDDFEIDLNGRSLPWEAAVLIPFANEDKFLSFEKQLYEEKGLQLDEIEQIRNIVTFKYPSY